MTNNYLLMIKPVAFGYNPQTADSNTFINPALTEKNVQQKALEEFNNFSALLMENHIELIIIEDTLQPHTPDSIFPNNWISCHKNGTVILYPMFAENRRLERRQDIVNFIKQKFLVSKIIDLSFYEQQEKFLESTGSMVLDRKNKIAYACLSVRTHEEVLKKFAAETGYRIVTFHAVDNNLPIYHTNVMMCMGTNFVVICMDSIPDKKEQELLRNLFLRTNKEVIEISTEQMNHFAGNMLEVKNRINELLLIMSETAYLSLNEQQIKKLTKHTKLIHAPLNTIENVGGGSARCMLAEVCLPMSLQQGQTNQKKHINQLSNNTLQINI